VSRVNAAACWFTRSNVAATSAETVWPQVGGSSAARCGRAASRLGVSSLRWHVLVCVRSPHDLLLYKLCHVMFHSPPLTVAAFHRAGADQHRGAVQLDHGRRIRAVCPRLRRIEGSHQAAV
jgi:hypothetical protein